MIRGVKISPHHIFGPSRIGGHPQLYQRGEGLKLYQKGEGLANLFSSIFGKVLPLAKDAIKKVAESKVVKDTSKQVLKSASNAALNIAADAVSGKSSKESMRKNLASARQDIANTIRNANKRTLADNEGDILKKKFKQSSKKKRKDVKIKVNKKHSKNHSYSVFQDE